MSGNKSSPWFRILALCTALGLGGAYVWRQQQKVTPPTTKSVERTVRSNSKSLVIDPVVLPVDEKKTDPPAIPQKPEKRILMPSSKSLVALPEQEAPKQRTLLPGSKSGSILEPPKTEEP